MTTETQHVYAPSEIDEQLVEAKRLVILDAPYAQSGGKRYQSRRALVEIVEQQREEITLLKQCHHCKHGDHRHAVDTKRCVNTIERRCQCEEPA